MQLCKRAGITLAVNQNMRYDQSIRACKSLLDQGLLGEPVLATIDMRAIPHWMPWQQRQGWVTLRIMSIHHLDTFRYLFGDPVRVFASIRPDPRTAKKFAHDDGICLYILEYANGLRCSLVGRRVDRPGARRGGERHLHPLARRRARRHRPRHDRLARLSASHAQHARLHDHQAARLLVLAALEGSLVPRRLRGTMAQLLCALEDRAEPEISGRDNLKTMALVDACYLSAKEHRAVELREITGGAHSGRSKATRPNAGARKRKGAEKTDK